MTKVLATVKAIITRLLFSAHSTIAIWQVTQYKKDQIYWCLSIPVGILFVEGIFTLAIKKNQEWRWFCPSVFLYLASVVPAIWLLELEKMDQRQTKLHQEKISFATVSKDLKHLDKMLGVNFKIPEIPEIDAQTWVTLIEQFLMLILIVGRWMLPKGDLTKDQLSQLLLVYIGTAADIIEFFDSFKDDKISGDKLLVFLTLGIWSWSLIQFTIVLSATRSRKPRGGGATHDEENMGNCCGGCCGIDAWGIALNIILQDAPFLTFRLLIIIHYKIISYMNVFFTCKNTLVILLQLYRLYVVHSEMHKNKKKIKQEKYSSRSKRSQHKDVERLGYECNDIYIISNGKYDHKRTRRGRDDFSDLNEKKSSRRKTARRPRKDTGYSTASSHTSKSNEEKYRIKPDKRKLDADSVKYKSRKYDSQSDDESEREKRLKIDKKKRKIHPESDTEKHEKKSSKQEKQLVEVTEESASSSPKKPKSSRHQKKRHQSDESDTTESD